MHQHLASHVADHYTFDDKNALDLSKVKDAFHELMILGPNFEFYILDNHGKVLAYSAEDSVVKREKVSLDAIHKFAATQEIKSPIYGDDPRSLERGKVFSAAPIMFNDAQMGYVYVIIGSQIQDQVTELLFASKITQWVIGVFIVGILFSLYITLLVTGFITNPLKRLTKQINVIKRAGFDHENIRDKHYLKELSRWKDIDGNEIHELGDSFKQAIAKLCEQYEKVVTVDELRQELLSHISHDLRTPLASMLGYLETWELNRANLSDEESERYIRTARSNAKKISVLIEQLFELAHLDSGNVQVRKERLALAELIQDVLVKFDIKARERNISLNVSPQDASITVMGDIEKLERVFTNLIENAIRHTESGGSVFVRLNRDSRFVAVEVSDTGIGIPESDIPHIFEPHYKAGNSVRENTAHGGLGLAITKKLLNLHHANIHVKSQVNQGTTFAFSLPVGA